MWGFFGSLTHLRVRMSEFCHFCLEATFVGHPQLVRLCYRQHSCLPCFRLLMLKPTSGCTFRRLLKAPLLLRPIQIRPTKPEGSRSHVVERHFPCEYSDSLYFSPALFICRDVLGYSAACGLGIWMAPYVKSLCAHSAVTIYRHHAMLSKQSLLEPYCIQLQQAAQPADSSQREAHILFKCILLLQLFSWSTENEMTNQRGARRAHPYIQWKVPSVWKTSGSPQEWGVKSHLMENIPGKTESKKSWETMGGEGGAATTARAAIHCREIRAIWVAF